MHVEPLTGLGHLAPVLAAWHHEEWRHLYAPGAWSLAIATRELERMAAPGSRDQTWVAFEGAARDAGALCGSVSLLESDGLLGFEHLSPWLASLYVAPAARGRGVAAALIDAVLERARAEGHPALYLFTSGQESFWSARGWREIARGDAEGHAATVMVRNLTREP
jgi:GNAT superfamily N-acetyltransferase